MMKSKSPYCFLALLVFAFLSIVIGRLFQFDGLYGQDGYAYLDYSLQIKSFILGGEKPLAFYWPPLYSLLCALLDIVINNMIVSAQIISTLSWVLIAYVSHLFIQKIFDVKNEFYSITYSIIFIFFAPYLVRFGLCSMSDVLATLMVLLTCFFGLKEQKFSLTFTLLFAGLAFSCRYATIVPIMPILGYQVYQKFKFRKIGELVTSVIPLFIGLIPFILFNGFAVNQSLTESIANSWSIKNYFTSDFTTQEGAFSYHLPNIIYGLYGFSHFAFFWLAIPLVIINFKLKIRFDFLLLLVVLLYALFIAGIPYQNKRFIILTLPLIAVLFFPLAVKAYQSIGSRFSAVFPFLFLLFNISVAIYTTKSVITISNEETAIVNEIKTITNKTIYTFEMDIPLKGRGINNTYINLLEQPIMHVTSGDFFLINPEKWKLQWSNTLVMENCNEILNDNLITKVKDLSNGWLLYKKL